MSVPCYLLEPTGRVQLWLRRYARNSDGWTCESGWHQARTPIGESVEVASEACEGCYGIEETADDFEGDERWPVTCEKCAYAFTADDALQVFYERIMVVVAAVPGAMLDVGMETNLVDAPGGALWFVDYTPDRWKGPDGRTVVCKLPDGHEWIIDSVASNCTLPDDVEHRCWCRTGEAPMLDVGKNTCRTCAAGAGSIASPRGYHGFLHNGVLT